MLAVLVGWFAAALMTGTLDVRGASTCPTPTEVVERAASLLVSEAGLGTDRFVQIDPAGGEAGLDLQLREKDAPAPLATRRLPAAGSCAARAEAAAVVIAVWAGRYDTPDAQREAFGDSEGAGLLVRASTRPGSPAGPTRSWWLGAGAFGEAAADGRGGLAPLAGPEITMASPSGRWFARLLMGMTGERQLSLESGTASWRRIVAAPALGARWGRGLFFETAGGPVVALVLVRGVGFNPNESSWSIDVGLSAALRLGARFGDRLRGWLSVSGVAWLRPHELSVAMSPRTTTVPQADLLLGLGADWRLGH